MSKYRRVSNKNPMCFPLPERMVSAMDDLGLDDLQKRPLYHDPFFRAWMKEMDPDHLEIGD